MIELQFQFLVVPLLLPAVLAATFPPPSGPFNTSLTITEVTDYTRLDPYSPTPSPRSLMISIFKPQTCIATPTPYMDPITAAWTDSQFAEYGIPNGTFESLHLLTCPSSDSNPLKPIPKPNRYKEIRRETKTEKDDKFPLLLFSPGLGNPRLYYSAIAQQISSRGYTVITIDHTYDAGIVVFPNNVTILGANITTNEQIEFDLSVRVKDVSFVLDHFYDSYYDCDGSQPAAAVFGQSLGGATAAQTMLTDERLAGGVNLDGSFWGSVIDDGLSRPFMMFAHDGKNTSTDPTWAAIWPRLTGWKRMLEVEDSQEGTFTDFPDAVDVLGLGDGQLPAEVGELLGSINGTLAMQIVGTYVGAFFDFVLKGTREVLLDGPSDTFPEVVFEEPVE